MSVHIVGSTRLQFHVTPECLLQQEALWSNLRLIIISIRLVAMLLHGKRMQVEPTTHLYAYSSLAQLETVVSLASVIVLWCAAATGHTCEPCISHCAIVCCCCRKHLAALHQSLCCGMLLLQGKGADKAPVRQLISPLQLEVPLCGTSRTSRGGPN